MVQGEAVVVGKLAADAGGYGAVVACVRVRQGLFPKSMHFVDWRHGVGTIAEADISRPTVTSSSTTRPTTSNADRPRIPQTSPGQAQTQSSTR